MPTNATFARRMFIAHKRLELRLGRDVSNGELAQLLGEQLRAAAPNETTVGRWFVDSMPRSHVTIAAIAKVYGVSAGWLTYGEGEMEPPGPHRNERRA